jgi:6-phosphogluconolactonase (cycloisomerase 2 family)
MPRHTFLAALALAAAAPLAGSTSSLTPGAVFALSNSPEGNAVVAYRRAADGSLSPAGSVPTGGAGSGAGLGSQNAVIVSDDRRFLFAVNAGSNSVSSFRIHPHGLELADVEPSNGMLPTSVAYRAGLLYVLNAGEPNNISGFTVDRAGNITPLAGSTRPLSGAQTSPAQIGFSADGAAIVVTERATSMIDTFVVGDDGLLAGPFVHASSGPVPFGFAINNRDILFVSEAGAGGGASSYAITPAGGLAPAGAAVMTGQRAACWAVVSRNGRYGYVTNAGTGNISGFAFGADGSLALLDQDGVTGVTGGNPTDAAVSHDGRFLYARVAALSEIAIFRIEADGSLARLPPLAGTPAGLAGLASY